MTQATIVIPIAPHHDIIAQRAIDSAKAQTVPCAIIEARDPKRRGPSYTRNRALEQVTTPFVVFLDADDWLEPQFVAQCLKVVRDNHYVYTDWYDAHGIREAPDKPWQDPRELGPWHVVTTLLPTWAVRKVGGFDDLPGAEDTELYWGLTHQVKCCGIRVPQALFHYGADGRRSRSFIYEADGATYTDAYRRTISLISKRYRDMACCGGDGPVMPSPEEGLPGDVLAQAIWRGNQQRRGPHSGRLYPRAGNGKIMYVDPADAAQRPDWWRLYDENDAAQQPNWMSNRPEMLKANGFHEFTRLFERHVLRMKERKPTLHELESVAPAEVAPDVATILRLAQAAYE